MRRAATAFVGLVDASVVAALVSVPHGLGVWWRLGAVASVVLLLLAAGHYRPKIVLGVGGELRSLALFTAVPLVALCVLGPAGTSKGALVTVAALTVGGVTLGRSVAYWAIRRLRSRGWLAERTLMVGAGPVSIELVGILVEHLEYGLQPVGFIDDVGWVESTNLLGLPLFSGVDELRTIIREQQVTRLVVAYGAARDADMVDVLRACEGTSVAVHVLPRFFELGLAAGFQQVDDLWGYQLVQLRRTSLRRPARVVKRAIDIIGAVVGLTLLAPLYGLLALAVKRSSVGPVHFHQRRLGQDEKPIDVLKFRTMCLNPRSDTQWTPGTMEVTRVGQFLRASGLDELPQLWNILRGDMSLVGPRPERPFFVEKFKAEIPRYGDRHRVPVGLTGLAQVYGLRGDTPVNERARLDNQYIENWSLWQDVVILTLTISAVTRRTLHARQSLASLPSHQLGTEGPELIPLGSDSEGVLLGAPVGGSADPGELLVQTANG